MRARQAGWKRARFLVGILILVAIPLLWLGGRMWLREPLSPSTPPVAVIRASATSGGAPLEVLFDASGSYDHDGDDIVAYIWDFGGGRTSSGSTVTQVFATPGEFTGQLSVTDARGKTGTTAIGVIVLQPHEVILEHNFAAAQGTEFDTGTGLRVIVPSAPNEGTFRLTVRHNPVPSQPPERPIRLDAAYTLSVSPAHLAQLGKLLTPGETGLSYRLEFVLPPNVDPRFAMLLYWKDGEWVLADNIRGLPGGELSQDGRIIWTEVDRLSTFALAWLRWEGDLNIALIPEVRHARINADGHLVTEILLSSPRGVLGLAQGAWYQITVSSAGLQFIRVEAQGDALFGFMQENTGFVAPGENKTLVCTFYGTGGTTFIHVNLEDGFRMAIADYLYRAMRGESLPWPLSEAMLDDALIKQVLGDVFSEEFTGVMMSVKNEGVRGLLKWIAEVVGGLWWRLAGTVDLAVATVIYNIAAAGDSIQVGAEPPSLQVVVEPSQASLKPGESMQFRAQVSTREGQALSTSSVRWKASGGGSIDQTGLFRASEVASGSFEVTARVLSARLGNPYWAEDKAAVRVVAVPSVQAPTVETRTATNVTATSATLNATVNPNGLGTSAHFEWGTSTTYGNKTPVQSIPAGTSDVPALANLTGLSPNTTYHFRVVATNSAGTTTGSGASFKTAGGRAAGQIAFASDRDGNVEIYVMNADGSNPRKLTDHPATDGDPAWSPDGTKIAFVSNRDGNFEIYVMNANGSNQRNLTRHPDHDWDPAWSPDGTKIAFTSHRDGNFEIYVMNADGSNQRNLTRHPDYDGGPAWSPDGTKIAFRSTRDRTKWNREIYVLNCEIYVMNADGTSQRNLTNHPAQDVYPAWSPDGTKIAFRSNRDGNFEIYVMNADGSNPRNLTRHPARDEYPAWSPDGTKIAFMSWRDGNREIYVMNADGSNPRNLTRHPAHDSDSAWSPIAP